MLTVADAVGRAAREVVEEAAPTPRVVDVLDAAWAVGQQALARTIEDNPVLAAAGVVDAGAAGYLLLLDAFLHVVDGRPLPIPDPGQDSHADLAQSGAGRSVDPHDPGGGGTRTRGAAYEVMFLLESSSEPITIDLRDGARPVATGREGVIAALAAVGDSVVVTGRPGCWTCHVHTVDIGAALEAALELGRPRRVRVEPLHPGG
jgi:dihydroxyacetone kinase-like predicted kinase